MTDIEKIYREHFEDVYRYIKRLSGSDHIAEEITSDTFLKALRGIGKFRGECDIHVWLCQIAKNSYYTYLKKHSSRADSIDDIYEDIDNSKLSLEEEVIINDEASQIKKILHDIPDPYKEVFMWRVFAEMSFSQIGNNSIHTL